MTLLTGSRLRLGPELSPPASPAHPPAVLTDCLRSPGDKQALQTARSLPRGLPSQAPAALLPRPVWPLPIHATHWQPRLQARDLTQRLQPLLTIDRGKRASEPRAWAFSTLLGASPTPHQGALPPLTPHCVGRLSAWLTSPPREKGSGRVSHCCPRPSTRLGSDGAQ